MSTTFSTTEASTTFRITGSSSTPSTSEAITTFSTTVLPQTASTSTSSFSDNATTILQTSSTTTVVAQSTGGHSALPVGAIVGGTLGGLAIVCLFIFGLLLIRSRERPRVREHTGRCTPLQKPVPPPHPSITPFPPHREESQPGIPETMSTNHTPNSPPAAYNNEKSRQAAYFDVDASQATTTPSAYSSSATPSIPKDPPPIYGV